MKYAIALQRKLRSRLGHKLNIKQGACEVQNSWNLKTICMQQAVGIKEALNSSSFTQKFKMKIFIKLSLNFLLNFLLFLCTFSIIIKIQSKNK